MKKFILSGLTIIIFGLYSLFVKTGNVFFQSPVPFLTINKNEVPIEENKDTPVTPKAVTTPVVAPKTNIKWKDGIYVGNSVDAYYGSVQVEVVISKDILEKVTFLSYPNDQATSREKSSRAIPILTSEAIKSQSAYVDSVSGVSYTSQAFKESLASALNQAKI
ncbi:FMN-binding protein [Patescibacteria group bacterium]|nr:FMN-binding protein [Patescibacteria group bacterium]